MRVLNGARVPDARAVPGFRSYELRRLRVPVGATMLSLVVPDAAAWRREGRWVAGLQRSGEPPYWTRVWPSAVAAARFVDRLGDLADTAVCDLGAGLGLPGIAAARRGARVTFVDREPDALAFAQWNARQHTSAEVRIQRVDWAVETAVGPFDLLLLADVSYRAQHHGPLLRHVERCAAAGGAVVHADPLREASTRFLARLGDVLAVETRDCAVTLADTTTPIRLAIGARSPAVLSAWLARADRRPSAATAPAAGAPENGR